MPGERGQALRGGPVVIDASVAVEYLVALSLTRHAAAVFQAVLDRDAELWAPDLLYAESASAFRRLVALKAIDAGAAGTALQDLLQLPILTTGTKALMEDAWRLRESLTVYDACYAALAHELDAPLVTADQRLVRALRQVNRRVTFLGDVV